MKKKAMALATASLMVVGLWGCAGQGASSGASGNEEAPEASSSAQAVAGPEGEAKARQLMEGLFAQRFDNVTINAQTTMEVEAGAASQDVAVDTTMLLDSTSGDPRVLMEVVSTPANDQTDMAMHLVGTEAIIDQAGEATLIEVDESYADQLTESTGGSAQARAIYDAASSVELDEQDGQTVVSIVADPAALTAAGTFAQLAEVSSCEADYVFDEGGRLTSCEIRLNGTSADSAGATLAIIIATAYSDYGTTVVPDLDTSLEEE